jgi:IS5 family transposase
MARRYAHPKQFKRCRRELRVPRTRLGRLIRDIRRKIAGDEMLEEVFAVPPSKASQIRQQLQQQRGWKPCSWHAPETECIGKGEALGRHDESDYHLHAVRPLVAAVAECRFARRRRIALEVGAG